MPTPYQLDLLKYLRLNFDLTVVYFVEREKDRVWDLKDKAEGYRVIYLKNNLIAKVVQKLVTSFHFSNEIKRIARELNAEFAIINGTYWSPNVQIAAKYSKQYGAVTAYWAEPVFPSKSKISSSV
jgi:hypothetical protein